MNDDEGLSAPVSSSSPIRRLAAPKMTTGADGSSSSSSLLILSSSVESKRDELNRFYHDMEQRANRIRVARLHEIARTVESERRENVENHGLDNNNKLEHRDQNHSDDDSHSQQQHQRLLRKVHFESDSLMLENTLPTSSIPVLNATYDLKGRQLLATPHLEIHQPKDQVTSIAVKPATTTTTTTTLAKTITKTATSETSKSKLPVKSSPLKPLSKSNID